MTDRTAVGFFVDAPGREGFFEHGGGIEGFGCYLIAHAEKGYGAVVMTNSDNGPAQVFELVRAIAREYGWDGYVQKPLEPATLPQARLDSWAGRYQLGSDTVLEATGRPGRLLAAAALEDPFELIPVSDDTFVRTDRRRRYRFPATAPRRGSRLRGTTRSRRVRRSTPRCRCPPSSWPRPGRGRARGLSVAQSVAARRPRAAGAAPERPRRRAPPAGTARSGARPAQAQRRAAPGLVRGERARAAEAYRKVLELAPSDPEVAA